MRRCVVLGLLALIAIAPAPAPAPSQYLFVWAEESSDANGGHPLPASMGRDFMAVFDIAPGSATFGRLVATLPVGTRAQMAHHTNYEMPANGMLFASDFMAGDAYVFDLHDPANPRLASTLGAAGAYNHPHSFLTLPNGNVLVTYQYKGNGDATAGGLAEVTPNGRVIRTSDASDPGADSFIRPYSLAVVPKLNRIVTSSADMEGGGKSHVVQVWRLSDLKLIKSVVLPKPTFYKDVVGVASSEPRLLADGKTVLVATFGCGLYRINDLAGTNPSAQFVYDFGYRFCAVPVVTGRYWVEATQSGHSLTSLDVSDPAKPVEVGHIVFKGDAQPHWIAVEPGGSRIVVTGSGWMATHAFFATIDPQTGALALEPHDIDFNRQWPDGWNGPAIPHGAVFSK
jgi:hypothetical protein